MGIKGINEIIYNSKIIKISKNIYFCIYKNWTVKITLSENKQEFLLHYNGVFVTTVYTYQEDYKIISFLTLEEYLTRFDLNL
jgi:hypothetical protein